MKKKTDSVTHGNNKSKKPSRRPLTKRKYFVVKTEDVADAEAALAEISPYFYDVFSTPFSKSGKEPVTHYVASVRLTFEQVALVESKLSKAKYRNKISVADASPSKDDMQSIPGKKTLASGKKNTASGKKVTDDIPV